MMRYQRVSPDYLPLTNTKKPYLRPSPSRSIDNGGTATTAAISTGVGRFNGTSTTISSSNLDGVPKGFRFRSTSITTATQQQQEEDLSHDSTTNPSGSGGGGDGLLQWGQRKRSRASRTEIRSVSVAAADDSSSSSGQNLIQSNRIQRRSTNLIMPPPSLSSSPLCGGGGRSTNPRSGFVIGKESSRFVPTRHLEDRSVTGSPSRNIGVSGGRMVSRSANGGLKRSTPSPEKTETRSNGKDHHHHHQRQNGLDNHHQRMNRSESTAQIHSEIETNNGEKTTTQVEFKEWPRIYIALSRKEKEEDFLAMKGTKLPHRPRKRAKNIDKGLQFCFPGMYMSDLNKSRYEVREKKSAKKQKRRGLKGMENLDSDSE
ncbi:uncharacterized protein LOC18016153 isoform X2 [Eutrema salsugineum]|uniref:uncharacterized protein LOC18016153 isoform X2 n=1 Tax=Eutrema salsugineum TaxID=72664 RepID=UPI000CED2425|nr:uncharacterized protein LOC18016153 isoform X2 [Eutrema salsugineum]